MTNAASKFAVGFAAQLEVVAGLSVVVSDASLASAVAGLHDQVIAFGAKTEEVCNGLEKGNQEDPFSSNPFSYFVLAGEGNAVAAAAADVAELLRRKAAPAKKKVGPARWATLGESLFDVIVPIIKSSKETGKVDVNLETAMSLIGEDGPLSGLISPELINEVMGAIMPALMMGQPLDKAIADFIATKVVDGGFDFVSGKVFDSFAKSALKAELAALTDIAATVETSGKTLDNLAKLATKSSSIQSSVQNVTKQLETLATERGDLKEMVRGGVMQLFEISGLSAKLGGGASPFGAGSPFGSPFGEASPGGDAGNGAGDELSLGNVDLDKLIGAMGLGDSANGEAAPEGSETAPEGGESGPEGGESAPEGGEASTGPASPGPENPCLVGGPTPAGTPSAGPDAVEPAPAKPARKRTPRKPKGE